MHAEPAIFCKSQKETWVGKGCQVKLRAQQGLPCPALPQVSQGCFRPGKRGVPTCVLPPLHIRTILSRVRTKCTCARRCKNVHGVCTHVGPPALSRLLQHPPFLSLFRWAKCTSHWVVYTYTGLVGWVMKRWLAAIKRVREVFHPLECMSAPPPPSAPQ